MSLYLKYRPTSLDHVYGNEKLVVTISGMLAKPKKFPHSILLEGPTGCGKTTIARIIARELGCEEKDIIELDTAQFRGIDTIREIRHNCQFKSITGGIKVYLLDEFHKTTNDAQNAILKILEDTPKHVYFIICTTDPQKLIKAILGRCSRFAVEPLDEETMAELVSGIAEMEEEKPLKESVINAIVKSGKGHPRNTLQILEQVLASPKEQRKEVAQKVDIEEAEGIELCRALAKRESWDKVKVILSGLKKADVENVRRSVVGYASVMLLSRKDDNAALILEQFINPFYDTGFPQLVLASYICIKG